MSVADILYIYGYSYVLSQCSYDVALRVEQILTDMAPQKQFLSTHQLQTLILD